MITRAQLRKAAEVVGAEDSLARALEHAGVEVEPAPEELPLGPWRLMDPHDSSDHQGRRMRWVSIVSASRGRQGLPMTTIWYQREDEKLLLRMISASFDA